MSVSNVSSSFTLPIPSLTTTKSVDSSSLTTSVADTTTSSAVDATIPTKWGFKVDANGFFGTDFNAAAGIPADVKINQKQMDMVEQYTSVVGSSDDPVTALGKVWSFFSKVAGSSLDSDGSMTINQVANMPFSYQSDGSLLDNPVSVQQTEADYTKVNNPSNLIEGMSQNTLDTGLRTFIGGQNSGSQVDPNVSYWKDNYKAEYGVSYDSTEASDKVSVGELFGHFCSDAMGGTTHDTYNNTKAYYSTLKSGQGFQSYLTDKFGADYVKDLSAGIDKVSNDPDMFDTLLKEIDQSMKETYNNYLQSQNSTSNSILESSNDNSTSSSSTLKTAYTSAKNSNLPSSGSLINIGI